MMFPRDVSFSLTGRAGHVRAVDCCRRTLGLGLDACTRARGPRSPALALDSLGEHLQRTAKHHLRSTGADTRLSSNHGSNERSPLRRNFQPRRWRTAVEPCARCCCKTRQKAAAAHPAICNTPSPRHSCTADRRTEHGSLAGPPKASGRRRSARPATTHTHIRRAVTGTHRSPLPHHRSSRTASSPSRTPRSAASARC